VLVAKRGPPPLSERRAIAAITDRRESLTAVTTGVVGALARG